MSDAASPSSFDVACLGLLVADTVGKPIDALPQKGTLALIDRIELHTGGNGANTGVALAKLGIATAALGKVGADNFGDFLVDALTRQNVHMRGVSRDSSTVTAATMVLVHSDAERTFLHVSGANAVFDENDVNWEIVGAAKILHIAGLQLLSRIEGEPLARILAEAKRRGLTTTLDTVMNPQSRGWDGIAPALPYLDWALPSFEEAALLTGKRKALQQAQALVDAGAKNAVIKMGANGCLVLPEGKKGFHVAPLRVAEAVDSLGAGDCWCAGFLAGLVHGWPLEKTLRFANATGAACVQAVGATTGIRSLDETLAMLE